MNRDPYDKRPIPYRNHAIGMGLLAVFVLWRLFS